MHGFVKNFARNFQVLLYSTHFFSQNLTTISFIFSKGQSQMENDIFLKSVNYTATIQYDSVIQNIMVSI